MNETVYPTIDELKKELKRSMSTRKYRSILRLTFCVFFLILLSGFIASFFLFSVLVIQDSGMEPTLANGDVVVAMQNKNISNGDVVAFYVGDQLLVKRIIASEGDVVSISSNGTVIRNGIPVEETYITEKALGECDFVFPYTVPAGRYFVLGDERTLSLDSRHQEIGSIALEQIVGRVFLRIWPVQHFSILKYPT